MSKVANWRALMAAFIVERRNTPHVWGSSDCATTAADCAARYCGIDYAAPLRGYSTRFGALRALRRQGAYSIIEYLDTVMPRVARPVAGDFVLVPQDSLDAMMVADGRGRAWLQCVEGLQRVAIPANAVFFEV